MSEISANRLEGRGAELLNRLMKKYSLSASNPGADILGLVASLSRMVRGNDQNACIQLALAIDAARKSGCTGSTADRNTGREEAAYLMDVYPASYDNYIARDFDFMPACRKHKAEKSAKRKRIFIILAAVIALAGIAVGIYNLPYFKEKRAYAEACEKMEEIYKIPVALGHYKYLFPEGKHLEDLYAMAIAKYASTEDGGRSDGMECSREYLQDFPDGPHAAEAEKLYNLVWDSALDSFNTEIAPSASPEARAYMDALLRYLRDNRLNMVIVNPKAENRVKEYSEYSPAVRAVLESMSDGGDEIGRLGNMLPVKDQINDDKIKGWFREIISSVQNDFTKMLGWKIVEFVEEGNERIDAGAKYPMLDLSIAIGTQQTVYGSIEVPDIWVYTSTNYGVSYEKKYMLGISLDYDARFTVPGSDKGLDISAKGDPGSTEINNIDKSEVYSVMCSRCTVQFIDRINAVFGLGDRQ